MHVKVQEKYNTFFIPSVSCKAGLYTCLNPTKQT